MTKSLTKKSTPSVPVKAKKQTKNGFAPIKVGLAVAVVAAVTLVVVAYLAMASY